MVSLNNNINRMPFASSNINENEEPINTLQSGRMQGRNDPRPGYISITGDSDDTTQLISRRDRNDEAGRLDSEESLPLSTSQFIFKRVDTISTGIFLTACSIALFVVSLVMPIECEVGYSCHLHTPSLLLYLHSLFWGISLICDQYIQFHHISVRRRGYLEFYSKMRLLSRLPFWTVSTWSTLLLTVSTILNEYCAEDGKCGTTLPLRKSEYIGICIGLELIVLVSVLGAYICKVWKFNLSKSFPDVLRDDDMATASSDFTLSNLGDIDEEIYQRQADLIQYYKAQNAMLRKTVLDLNRQICNRTINA